MMSDEPEVVEAENVDEQTGEIIEASKFDTEEQIQKAQEQIDALNRITKEVLEQGTDYKDYSWSRKPFLHQPGAEQLQNCFRLETNIEQTQSVFQLDNDECPFIKYEYNTVVYSPNGRRLCNAVGSANSWEKRFRFDKQGNQRPDNEIVADDHNIQIIAQKRSFVTAIRRATGASRLFSSDEDTIPDYEKNKSSQSKPSDDEPVIPFGDAQGTPISEADTNDLQWIKPKLDTEHEKWGDKNQQLVDAIENELEQRNTDENPAKDKSKVQQIYEDIQKLRKEMSLAPEHILATCRERYNTDITDGFSNMSEIDALDLRDRLEALEPKDLSFGTNNEIEFPQFDVEETDEELPL